MRLSLPLPLLFLFRSFRGSQTSNSSSLLGWKLKDGEFLCRELRDRLLVDDSVEMDDGEEGIEFEWCDDGGGVSNKGNDDKRGSFNIRSGSSRSLRLMIFFASSASRISSDEACC